MPTTLVGGDINMTKGSSCQLLARRVWGLGDVEKFWGAAKTRKETTEYLCGVLRALQGELGMEGLLNPIGGDIEPLSGGSSPQ